MTSIKTQARVRNRFVLLLILGIFVGPIAVAWLYSSGRVTLPAAERVNRGILVEPPLDLTAEHERPGIAPLFRLQPSEWAVVLLTGGECEEQCARTLDDLLTLRELLGQGGVRVSTHAIAGAAGAPGRHLGRVQEDRPALEFLTPRLFPDGAGELPVIVLVDWRHQLVMRYAAQGELSNIQRDLKRLLRASAIR